MVGGRFVVDNSAVVDALTRVEGTDELRSVLSGAELCAPALLDFEVVAAFRGLLLGGHLSSADADAALIDYGDLRIERWPSADAFRRRILELGHLSGYDAAYVVLAEALGCPLVTRDRRLARSSGQLITVRVV